MSVTVHGMEKEPSWASPTALGKNTLKELLENDLEETLQNGKVIFYDPADPNGCKNIRISDLEESRSGFSTRVVTLSSHSQLPENVE